MDDLDSDPDTSWMPPGQSARSSRSLMAMWVGGGGADAFSPQCLGGYRNWFGGQGPRVYQASGTGATGSYFHSGMPLLHCSFLCLVFAQEIRRIAVGGPPGVLKRSLIGTIFLTSHGLFGHPVQHRCDLERTTHKRGCQLLETVFFFLLRPHLILGTARDKSPTRLFGRWFVSLLLASPQHHLVKTFCPNPSSRSPSGAYVLHAGRFCRLVWWHSLVVSPGTFSFFGSGP